MVTVVGDTVTIAGGSGWTPAIGDTLISSGYGVVVSVASATVFDVRATSTISTGTAFGYEMPEAVVKWATKTAKAPHVQKHWRDNTLLFESAFPIALATVGYTTELSTTEDEITHEVTPSLGGVPRNFRGFVSRDHSRSTRLDVRVTIGAAASQWELAGMSLTFEPMRERV